MSYGYGRVHRRVIGCFLRRRFNYKAKVHPNDQKQELDFRIQPGIPWSMDASTKRRERPTLQPGLPAR
jgi:hypothetical protein